MQNLLGRYGIYFKDSVSNQNVVFSGNRIQFADLETRTVFGAGELSSLVFRDSTYYTDRDADDWFSLNGVGMDFTSWQSQADEPSAIAHKLVFPDATRTLQTYMAAIGETGTYEAFIAAVRSRSKMNWRPELTAHAINEYFRDGFATLDVVTTGLPPAVVGQPYNAALHSVKASGSVFWTLYFGDLPSGLALSSNGVISGTPQAVLLADSMTNSFTVLAHDDVNIDPRTFSIMVVPEPLAAAPMAVFALLVAARRTKLGS
jgi:hypothetical protein